MIKVKVYYDSKFEVAIKKLTVVNKNAPKLYTYEIVNTYPRGFEKHVIKSTDEFKMFDEGFDEEIDDIINPKLFWL